MSENALNLEDMIFYGNKKIAIYQGEFDAPFCSINGFEFFIVLLN